MWRLSHHTHLYTFSRETCTGAAMSKSIVVCIDLYYHRLVEGMKHAFAVSIAYFDWHISDVHVGAYA